MNPDNDVPASSSPIRLAPLTPSGPPSPWDRIASTRSGRASQRGKQRQLLGAAGARRSVEHNKQQPFRTANSELLAAERELPNLGVEHTSRRRLAGSDIVSRPEVSKPFAGQRQFPRELNEPWILDITSHRLAEGGD
jgi:hypothetical protein